MVKIAISLMLSEALSRRLEGRTRLMHQAWIATSLMLLAMTDHYS